MTTSEQYDRITDWSKEAAGKVARTVKIRQMRKFDALYVKRFGRGLNPD